MNKDELISRINEARNEALKEWMDANAIIINERLIKTQRVPGRLPAMICGLEVHEAKDLLPAELPDNVLFAIMETTTSRNKLIEQTRKKMAREILDITSIHGRRYIRKYLKERYDL